MNKFADNENKSEFIHNIFIYIKAEFKNIHYASLHAIIVQWPMAIDWRLQTYSDIRCTYYYFYFYCLLTFTVCYHIIWILNTESWELFNCKFIVIKICVLKFEIHSENGKTGQLACCTSKTGLTWMPKYVLVWMWNGR